MNFFRLFWVAILCAALSGAWAQVQSTDSLALVALYNSTGGPNWFRNWDLTQPVGTWHGITIDAVRRRVNQVDLSSNNLVGTLPDLALPDLVRLNLGYNTLSGALPTFSSVPRLQFLSLRNNQFSSGLTDWTSMPLL